MPEPPPTGTAAHSPRKHGRRWLDAVAVVALVLVPQVFPAPFFFRSNGLLGADRSEYHAPYVAFEHESLRAGTIPFWNPFVYGGVPEFGNPERAPMYPPHLAGLLLLGPAAMLDWKFLFHVALAGVGTYALLRLLAVGPLLAFLGALTVQWSGWTQTRIALPNVGDSAAWAPAMLALNLWFGRRPNLGRGLVYAAAGGCMLLLFFPQITLTTVLVLALFGAARFVRSRAARAERRFSPAWWLTRVALPAVELAVVLAILRYPRNAYRFPGNLGGNVSGLGAAGLALLAAAVGLWGAWLVARGWRPRVDARGLARWAWRFAAVWALAGALAAPQLAVTGEMIARSNQQALRYEPRDFFTGAQAYGCVQEFVRQSALLSPGAVARPKEPVNNMALGPAVWVLGLAGLAVGLHRRRRVGLLLGVGIVAAGTVYMGPLPVLEALRRLPFYGKFAGLSRYEGFLSLFLVLWGVLAADAWARRMRGRAARRWIAAAAALALAANLVLLVRHDTAFWRHLLPGGPSWTLPAGAAEMVTSRLAPGERMNLDVRAAVASGEAYQPMLMAPMTQRWPSLATISPMRTAAYDRWMHDHNAALGTNHDDYRAGFWEPAPTVWTRALRLRWFLYPPGAAPPTAAATLLTLADERDGWHLYEDRATAPDAWPAAEADLAGPPPGDYPAPGGWSVAFEKGTLHRRIYSLTNPGAATWMVVPQPRYPGWRAFDAAGAELPVREAYGLLTAVRVPTGRWLVRLEYCPASFAWAWVGALTAAWAWLATVAGMKGRPARETLWRVTAPAAAAGLVVVLTMAVAHRLFDRAPDALAARALEAGVVAVLGPLTGWNVWRWRENRRLYDLWKREGRPKP